MKQSNRILQLAVRSVVASFLFISIAPADAPATAPVAETKAVEAVKTVVKPGTFTPKVSVDGYMAPVTSQVVKIKLDEHKGNLKITQVISNGAKVKVGDVLLAVDDTDIKKAVATAENELKIASATLDKTQKENALTEQADALQLDVAKQGLATAQAKVEWWDKVDGPEMLHQLDMTLKNANDGIGDQSDELDQLKKMYKSEDLTNATADIVVKRAVRRLEESKDELETLKKRIDRSKAVDYVSAKQDVVNQLNSQKNAFDLLQVELANHKIVRETTLFTAQQGVNDASKKLTDLQADAAKFVVKATSDGVALYGKFAKGAWTGNEAGALKVGEDCAPDAEAILVYQPGALHVVAELTEADALLVPAGLPVRIVPVSLPQALSAGKTSATAITASNGMYDAYITLDKVDPSLAPGAKVKVSIELPIAKDVLVIPVGSVKDGKVTVVTDDTETERAIVTGRTDGKWIEVIDGLKAGETIKGAE